VLARLGGLTRGRHTVRYRNDEVLVLATDDREGDVGQILVG